MAIIIHSNAIIEEIGPIELVFTEDEILNSFNENYHTMCSKRISEIPNTWAVWGLMDNPPENEFNMIGSDIVELDIDSPLMIIHDSEINPKWKLTDDILQKSYEEFLHDISRFVNEIAIEVIKEDQSKINNGEKDPTLIALKQLGITSDKKLLFLFDLNSQTNEFFSDHAFVTFSQKILEYLQINFNKNLKKKAPFTIFDDNKTVVIVNDEMVEPTLIKIIKTFERVEHYESCKALMEIKEKWINKTTIATQKKTRGRPKKI
jgi:hypothetical protein